MTENRYAAQIAAGEAWLDENRPDWVQAFAADRAAGLHMENCDRCVLGYVLGSYWHEDSPVYRYVGNAPRRLSYLLTTDQAEALEQAARAGAELGFTLSGNDDDAWDELTEGWRALIEKRLADAGLMAAGD